jgi:translation initiation factor 3 subunit E
VPPRSAPAAHAGPHVADRATSPRLASPGHLLIPLIDFLASKNMHTKEELEKSKLAVLFKTNMLDFAMDIYKELHGTKEVPGSMAARRDEVMKTMEALKEEVAPILEIVSDPGRVSELKAEKCFNQAYLQQQLNITPQHVEVLYRYAKFVYECGDYATAGGLLQHYRQLTLDTDKAFSALWGKLCCEILSTNWEGALEDLNALRDLIGAHPRDGRRRRLPPHG